jgi:O-antigen ligase
MAALNSIAAIYSFTASSTSHYRSEGLLENPVNFGHFAVLAFPLALYQYLYRSGLIKWLGLGLSAILVGGVVVSVSRGAVVSLILVFLAILVAERRRILPLLLVGALCLCMLPLAPSYFHERVSSLTTDIQRTIFVGEQHALTSRGYLNKAGVKIWLAHPVLGVGMGNFGYYYVEKEFNPGFKNWQHVGSHSIYIQALSETGTVGFLVLVWLIVTTMRNIIQARRASIGDPSRWLYFGAIQMMAIAVFISTSSYGNLLRADFWMIVCLTAVSSRVTLTQEKLSLPEGTLVEAAAGSS